MASEIKVDTISEKTSAGGVTIDGLLIKDGGISGDVALIGTTPTFTIGDAGTEDAALVFDGNAQDFYIALDDSEDDLVIGLGSTVGTTPIIAIDENKLSTFSGAITVGVDDTGHDVKLFGATSGSYALWDESADDLNLIASGLGVITAKDLGVGIHIRSADSGASVSGDADELVVEGSANAGISILGGTGNACRIYFGDSGDNDIGQITYAHDDNQFNFVTNATAAMNIDSNGRLNVVGAGGKGILIGSTDANAATLYLDGDSNGDASGSDYSYITHDTTGRLYFVQDSPSGTNRIVFLHAQTVESLRMDSTAAVFNDGGADINFRVEGDGDTHLIFADASADDVYIGYYTGSDNTDAMLYVATDQNKEVAKLTGNNGSYGEDVIHLDCTRAGTSSYNLIRATSNGNNDSEMILNGLGALSIDGTLTESGADYAEYFEWNDGNSSDENRVGYSVVLDDNKIVKATDSDDASKIIGVISGAPAVVGDGDIERWKQKYLRDDYGKEIWEEHTITEWEEEQTNVKGDKNMVTVWYETDKIPDDVTPPGDAIIKSTELDGVTKLKRRKLNPDWNKDTAYISRKDRKEWDTVGLMGKLRLKKGQPTGTNWIKMRDISDSVEEWLVR